MPDTTTVEIEVKMSRKEIHDKINANKQSIANCQRRLEKLRTETEELVKELEKIPIDFSQYSNVTRTVVGNGVRIHLSQYHLGVRQGGNYTNRGFSLTAALRWEVVTDSDGTQVLIPSVNKL